MSKDQLADSDHYILLVFLPSIGLIHFQFKKFQSNLIFNIRSFPLYLAENIFENFTAQLSLFELSRCETIMCFAIETKSERKNLTDFTLFRLKFEKLQLQLIRTIWEFP